MIFIFLVNHFCLYPIHSSSDQLVIQILFKVSAKRSYFVSNEVGTI
ncbi:hypothetical protein HanIR_Chr01g0035891 [Helianthus annuus]|nr:hypothetical protein HanIR_Chr01g0035891 [Helianthus annuus]